MTSEAEETALDMAWLSHKLEAERDVGHCGESTSEKIDRQRRNRRIDRILAALSRAPEAGDLGGSTRMTSPASRSQTPLSAGLRLCEAFATTFEGGGWADAPEWADFDESQQRRWDRTATLFLQAFSDNGWQDISTAPQDGTPFLATTRVFNHLSGRFSHHDTHVIYCDDETGEIHDDCELGWRLEDYEHWMPLPPPPAEEGPSGAQRSELSPQAPDHPIPPSETNPHG